MQTTVLNNAAVLSRSGFKNPEAALAYAERLMAINASDPRGYRIAAAVHVDAEAPAEVIAADRGGFGSCP